MHVSRAILKSEVHGTAGEKPAHKRQNPRPQRLHIWLTLIPLSELDGFERKEVLFLDTFVVIERRGRGADESWVVLFEGEEEMRSVEHIGLIFVWYGDDLKRPARPFPALFDSLYDSAYVTSRPTVFEDTHVMDFVENGSDNLHFKAVHLWEHSRIYDHRVTPETITLKQDTRFRYGACSTKASVRLLSKLLPKLELTQDYVYHGPGLAVVGATGSGTPRMHALVSLTPEGAYRTRVYVTMAIDPTTFPAWAERLARALPGGRPLCDLLASLMANYIKNEFDIDAIVWAHRKHLDRPRLLPSERHLARVIEWGKTFYPKDFEPPRPPRSASPGERRWHDLDAEERVADGALHRYSIGDRELVARTTENGELGIFDAFCPHQGAHLGHGGRIEEGCIRCPFHGFYFDPDGRCVGSNLKNRDTFIEGLELERIDHRIRGGRVEVLV